MNYFYILKSQKDNKYYYGSTSNLKNRYAQHCKGLVEATKHRRPLELVYYEAYQSIGLARTREQQVKSSGSARRTLLNRINNEGP